MCREAANSDSRKAMADGIKGIHSSKPQRQRTGDGQQDINQPQGFRRFRNSRAHFVIFQRAGHFCAIELHPTHAEDRQYRNRQHDDPHTAKPLQHLAIKEDGMRERIQPHQRSGPRGGQARERFKKRIGNREVRAFREDKRERTDATQHGPEQHHYQKPLTGFQFALLFAVRPPKHRANGEGDKKGLGKSAARSIPVDECYQPRDNHGP